jgi:dTDP-glucose 4,6-dehydratase
MKLLITGGAGFIGSHFIRLLLRENAKLLREFGFDGIVNLDCLSYAGNLWNLVFVENDAPYRFVRADIADRECVSTILREESIGAVVHFAAETHVDRSIDSPEAFFRTNVMGTFHLAECLLSHWRNLPAKEAQLFRFLNVSTDEVYGSLGPDDSPATETSPMAPNSPYAASKASGDCIVRAFHSTYGFPAITTRCSNNFGPFQNPEKLTPATILAALAGRKIPIYGDGLNQRDWLHVEDHCRALLLVLGNGRPGRTYNIAGGNERSNAAIVDRICAILDRLNPRANGRPHSERITFVRDRPGHDRRYALCCDRIRDELNWKPLVDFETGLEETVLWYLNRNAAVKKEDVVGYQSQWLYKNTVERPPKETHGK